MNRSLAIALVTAMLSLSAFGCSASMTPPAGFAKLDSNDDYTWRATSAEGVVMGVRREKNEPAGNLDFWASAVRYELERKGYAGVELDTVRSRDGVEGRRLKCHTTRDGRPNVMWATVFVTEKRVVVVEAGGDQAHFEGVEKSLDAALRTLEVG